MTKVTSKKNIVVTLTFILIILVGLCGCTTTPSNEEQKETLLTITVDSLTYNYTLDDLLLLKSSSGRGSYINSKGTITGPNNFTGVSMGDLLNTIPTLPYNYSLHAIASDDYTVSYSMDEINGYLTVFNETGDEIGIENLTMIVAYLQNGEYLNESTNGPLRIAFIGTQPYITRSGMWLSSLVKIEILEID
jgi:hypothetical protein